MERQAKIDGKSGRDDPLADAIVLGVLDLVERNPEATQRLVASDLGIALGLVNAYLRRCVRKGLIKVRHVPRRRYVYFLTPRGMTEKSRLTASYLAHSFAFFREARGQCDGLFMKIVSQGRRRLVLIGIGDLAEIATLVARQYPIEITEVVPACVDAEALTGEIKSIGTVDAVIVTALDHPREVVEAALAVFGPERVYVPDLLRVRPAATPQPASVR